MSVGRTKGPSSVGSSGAVSGLFLGLKARYAVLRSRFRLNQVDGGF